LHIANDAKAGPVYVARVSKTRPKRYTNWFLREWMRTLKVNQAKLVEDTGYSKTTVSLLYNDQQDYSPSIVRDVASALKIPHYELLMHPDDAMAMRQLRKDALRVVENSKRLDNVVELPQRSGATG